MPPTIVNLASLNQDITCEAPRIPAPGETILGTTIRYSLGGKGGNQAVASSRLGAEVHVIAAVGDDDAGRRYLSTLAEEGIGSQFVAVHPQEATGTALIEVDAEGNNSILVISGANHAITAAEVQSGLPAIRASRVVMSQLEVPFERVRELFELGRDSGAVTILNPSPARPLSELADMIALTDVLVPNEIEIAQILERPITSAEELPEACGPLFELGVSWIVVTLGPKGCAVLSKDRLHLAPAYPGKAVDTTAAGDSFLGALAGSLAGCQTLTEADILRGVEWGNRTASITVQRQGAHSALPTLDEVLALP